jgi:hypothetical protein
MHIVKGRSSQVPSNLAQLVIFKIFQIEFINSSGLKRNYERADLIRLNLFVGSKRNLKYW